MKRFRIYENQLRLLTETDDYIEAVKQMKRAHKQKPNKYHELYQLIDGQYIGIRQYKPGDKVRW